MTKRFVYLNNSYLALSSYLAHLVISVFSATTTNDGEGHGMVRGDGPVLSRTISSGVNQYALVGTFSPDKRGEQ